MQLPEIYPDKRTEEYAVFLFKSAVCFPLIFYLYLMRDLSSLCSLEALEVDTRVR